MSDELINEQTEKVWKTISVRVDEQLYEKCLSMSQGNMSGWIKGLLERVTNPTQVAAPKPAKLVYQQGIPTKVR